ncbi:hypothetical protein RJ639_030526 [Escallonia herrerae]|uniref:Uncharacterized protein n=1 Tax=Escallonia herrerae TaxID=1293975 RepID=A0AA88WYL4_9ASTE|nr:hypothetical protein RJ639_030526 [Escallonia herrerae]
MSDGCMTALVEAIHSAPSQAVLYISGGASQTLGWLISVPGASNTVLEALIPYSRMSMIQLLGKVPVQFTSRKHAEDMALAAYNRALKLSNPDDYGIYKWEMEAVEKGRRVLGVGFTGSLASTRPKLGDHRFHLSTRTSDRLFVSTVTLSKGLRTREQEERVSSLFLLKHVTSSFIVTSIFIVFNQQLQAIANACNVQASFSSELTDTDVADECEEHFDEDQELEQLISGKICFKVYPFSSAPALICGDGYPCFEISAVNADKPPLTLSQIKDRVSQFEKVGKTVIISNQPYFYKKAELFPGSAFVIGADTTARLVNPKYYGGDYGKMLEILVGCKNTGCTFLVGGRNVDGVFKVLEDLDIPEELRDMFISIPVEKFRMDISSTEIRKRQGI